ncbi:MAG: enoyl-CoA hydratase/isomerase family protein [Sphingomonas sp.]|uniref:enoyl-CoA hydratase-related protein n=1 Tax=Sphingomonas sp. TaxID=28214 RepID=UPI001AD25DD0|nr:enoyl-CoA hydratase-related protein [Sphingomonas sp.]MBN8808711.1 enoyl-CoA hydratase/isomerase family protein [Sphingomonas sp.]
MDQPIIDHFDQGLLTLTMNRPDTRNALSSDLLDALLDALDRAASDRTVRAVLLRGAGGTFSVGGDVKAMADPTQFQGGLEARTDSLRRRARISELLHEMPKPTIAMIERAAAGAGLSIALACDFRIAGEKAKLTTAFAKVALSGDFGGPYFLAKLIGSARTRDLYMTSPVLTGADALMLGIVTRVAKDDELEAAALAFARDLAAGPTLTFAYMKKTIAIAESQSLKDLLDHESLYHSRSMATDDHREAASSFVEKRPASFTGR